MHVSRRYPTRLVLAIAIAATVLVIGAAAAFGQGAPRSDQPVGGGGVSGMPGTTVASPPDASVSSDIGIAAPAWCCGTSAMVPGLTTVDGIAEVAGNYPSKGGRGELAAWFRDLDGNLFGIGQPVQYESVE